MPPLSGLSSLYFGRLLPFEIGAVDLLVYTPGEFRQMQQDGNAFAEMIVQEGRVVYAGPQG